MTVLENVITSLRANLGQRDYPQGNPAFMQSEGGIVYLGNTIAGPVVTEETAYENQALLRAHQIVASTIAGSPLHVYERDAEGNRHQVRDPREAYLWERPNPEMTRMKFWETLIGHELTGNAYIYVVPNGLGDPLEMWPLEPKRVRVARDADGTKIYAVDGKEKHTDFRAGGRIVHVAGFGRDGLRGFNTIRLAAQALGLGKAAEEYAARFFANDMTPGGIITTDQEVSPEEAKILMERWARLHQPMAQKHRIGLMDKGAKFQATSVDPDKAMMIPTRDHQLGEVERSTGVAPHLLADVDRSTSWGAGIEEQGRNTVTYTIQPHTIRFEQAISDDLLKRRNRYMKWELDGLLRGDSTSRAAFYTAMIQAGVYSINDVRRLEDMEKVAVGGDYHLIPLNMARAEDNGKPALKEAVEAVAVLVRAGFSPEAALEAMGLPPITHLGLLPITLQQPVDAEGDEIPQSKLK